MNADPLFLAGIAVTIFLGGMIQGAIGFAYSLFVTPILVWMGLPLPDAIMIISSCSFTQSAMGAWQLRADLPWREASWATAARIPTLVLGALLLRKLTFLSVDALKLTLGGIICLIVALQIALKVKPTERLHRGWGALAFTTSGLMLGLVGMGGPPVVMWVMAHNWSSVKTRSFLFAVFFATPPLQFGLFALVFGPAILKGLLYGLLLTPVVLLGSQIGIRLGNRMSKTRLRNIAYLVLILIGLSAMAPPLFRLLAP